MTAQHTPGRLVIHQDHTHKVLSIEDAGDFGHLKINSPWVEDAWEGDEEAEANARRLVACWNACEGISTEALEGDEAPR